MVTINVVTREAETLTISGQAGRRLMEVLRDEGLGVEGTCGGACSCGTCHVYVANGARLDPPGEDESDMIAALGDVGDVRETSRLSCQIILGDSLDGLEVEIAPAF